MSSRWSAHQCSFGAPPCKPLRRGSLVLANDDEYANDEGDYELDYSDSMIFYARNRWKEANGIVATAVKRPHRRVSATGGMKTHSGHTTPLGHVETMKKQTPWASTA